MPMIAIALLLAAMPDGQINWDARIDRAERTADAALNAQYRATMAAAATRNGNRADNLKKGVEKPDAAPTYQAALLASERAWLRYRDARCALTGHAYRGGTMQDPAEGQCIADLGRSRVAELKQIEKSFNN